MSILSRWLPTLAWMSLIFFLSSRPTTQVSDEYTINFLVFKSLHIIEYGFLYILFYRSTRQPVLSFVLTVLYAMSDEWHQTMVPTREGKVRDVIIDGIGASLAWIAITQLLPHLPNKQRTWAKKLGIE